MPIKCVVTGALGRMGRTVIKLLSEDKDFELIGAVERRDHPQLAIDVGYLVLGKNNAICVDNDLRNVIVGADVVIDFTEPDASIFHAEVCADKKVAFICGTTGFSDEKWQKFTSYAVRTKTVYSPNFSAGVFVLRKLAQIAAIYLDDWDVELVEIHHKKKLDSPSGTAKLIAQDVIEARKGKGVYKLIYGREGRYSERALTELGIHAVRGGDVFGEHTLYLFGPSERLELTHKASSREAFAKGALLAAKFIVGAKENGIYSMEHVLKFELPKELFAAEKIGANSDEKIPTLADLEPSRR